MNIAIASRYRKMGDVHFREWECVPRSFCVVADELGINLVSVPTNNMPRDILSLCSGLILTGSSININPSIYGDYSSEYIDTIDEYSMDEQLISFFRNRNQPIMGICGGMQAVNVAFGGSLKPVFYHNNNTLHEIRVNDSGFLSKVKGMKMTVNSFHNYVVDRLGNGLTLVAKSNSDVLNAGVVEAIESNDGRVFGVQWHPEEDDNFYDSDSVFFQLFSHFIGLCQS